MRNPWRSAVVAGVLVAFVAALDLGFGSTLRKWLYSQAIPENYFSRFDGTPAALYQVSGPVYAFERGFTRSLVLRTSEGIAVVDTFSDDHAAGLAQALAKQFPGEPVRWLVYSHNHLDHIRGSERFAAAEVIGHVAINELLLDWPVAGKGVARVSRPLAGDATLTLGDVELRALYMPYSHSHTLYGFHVPSAGVVYAPDMMFVRMLPPYDFPDFYYPGYVRALDRLIALQAAHYVPSHADRGDLDDLVAYRNMTVEFQEVVRDELLSRGIESATDGTEVREALRAAYDRLDPKYGDWHGFDAMFVPKFGRHVGGTYLGY